MENINKIVANNLIELRKKNNLTQQQLAEKMSFSDKTISKWEQGKAIPSVETLKELADFYQVSLDYFVHPNEKTAKAISHQQNVKNNNHFVLIALLNTSILLIATVIYVWSALNRVPGYWTSFIWAIPACLIVSFYFVFRWFRKNRLIQCILLSLFLWFLLLAFYLQFLNDNIWYIFFLGIPAQIAAVLIYIYKL